MRKVLLLAVFCFVSCALPRPYLEQKFISPKEMTAISLVREGFSYFEQGRFVDAELKFRQALYLFPKVVNTRKNLALTLERLQNYEESEALYKKLLEETPDSIDLKGSLAALYYTWGKFDKAIPLYKEALDQALNVPDGTKANTMARSLSVLYFKIGNEEEALCYSEFASFLLAQPPEIYKMAKLWVALGYNQKAKDQIESFFTLIKARTDPQLLYALALANFGLGDKVAALDAASDALDQHAADLGLDNQINLVEFFSEDSENAEGEKDQALEKKQDQLKAKLIAKEQGKKGAAKKKEENSDEEEANLESSVSQELSHEDITLYMPLNLLRAIADYRAKKEADEANKGWFEKLFE